MQRLKRRLSNPLVGLWWIAGAGALALLVAYQLATGGVGGDAAYAARKVRSSKSHTTTIKLHGSTPTMAWSPDGKRLAFNAAYEYYGFRTQRTNNAGHLGVFVYNTKRKKIRRVTSMQGFHPLWLTNTLMAWGHSPYEHGKSGLYTARLKRRGSPKVKRIGSFKGVYHTLPGKKKGRVVFYSGWPEYKRWVWVNIKKKKLQKIKKKVRRPRQSPPSKKGSSRYRSPYRPNRSWDAPKGRYKNQCLQKVGKTSINMDSSGTITVTTATQNMQLPRRSYNFRNYGRSGCPATGHCGPVKACLSPKGRHLAYFSSSGTKGAYYLHIMKVPK